VKSTKLFAVSALALAVTAIGCSSNTAASPTPGSSSAAGAGVTNMTTAQAVAVWTGQTTNWSALGGPNENIVLIIRPDSSGTRATFRKIVLGGATEASGQALTEDSNGAVTAAITSTPGSTSVIGFSYYQSNKANLNALQLDGVDATVDNMVNGTYKLQAVGHMYTLGDPTGLTAAFLDYMQSKAVQNTLLPSLFYAPAVQNPADAPASCVDGSITVGGSTALQPVVEAAAGQYTTACPNSHIDVQGGGSGTGLSQVAAGAFNIGNSDVFAADKLPTPQATTLVDHQVAIQGWVMVTNTDVGPH
jgi:ABC-type phosphate transport system substrate-binding protein